MSSILNISDTSKNIENSNNADSSNTNDDPNNSDASDTSNETADTGETVLLNHKYISRNHTILIYHIYFSIFL